MRKFSGTITALVTPFHHGEVDFAALRQHIERQIAAGVDGLAPCGTTGESPTLTHLEHDRVIESVVEYANRRVPVIAGTGSNSTEEAVYLSQQAEKAGADALLSVTPYYNKPTQEGLYQHFAAIAGQVGLPIVLYNVPGRCGVELSVDTICRLAESFANIVAVKHATGRVDDAAELMSRCPIAVLSGDDPLTLPLMSLGAVGVVSVASNLAPTAVKRLTDAALAGDMAGARLVHQRLYSLVKALLGLETNPIPIKTAMALKGWCSEEFRLPLCPMAPERRTALVQVLERFDAI
jgi:4-hydroxy-tetrahydrodipicolinate synthase